MMIFTLLLISSFDVPHEYEIIARKKCDIDQTSWKITSIKRKYFVSEL